MKPADRAFIEEVIKTTVNGKIDRLTERVEASSAKHEEDMTELRRHIEETRPIIEAYQGGKALGGLVRWIAGVGAAVIIIHGWLSGRF